MRSILGLLLAALLLAALGVKPASAQQLAVNYDVTSNRVSIDAADVDVTKVVSALFARVGGSRYVYDGDVKGKVTTRLAGATPESALSQVLGQVGARYEVRNGVYHIVPNGRPGTGGQAGSTANEPHSVTLRGATMAQAAKVLSDTYGKQIRVEGDPKARVSLNLKSATLKEALGSLKSAVDASGPIDVRDYGDVIVIIPIEKLPGPDDVPAVFRVYVDVNARERPIGEVTGVLSRQGKVNITYDRDVPGDLTVTAMAKHEQLWTVLQRLAIAAHLKLAIVGPRDVILRPMSSIDVDYRGDHVGSVNEEYGTCAHCHFRGLKTEWRYCPMCGERLRR